MFYQWHKEGFDVPTGATLLAQSAIFDNQVSRYGEMLAVSSSIPKYWYP